MTRQKKNKVLRVFLICLISFVYLLSYFIIVIGNWTKLKFNTGLEEIVFTLSNPLKGANTDTVTDAVLYCVPRIVVFIILSILVCWAVQKVFNNRFLEININKKSYQIKLTKLINNFGKYFCLIAFVISVFHTDKNFGLFEYIRNQLSQTTIYEQYYIDPGSVEFSLKDENGKKKNLIYIYLESMENVYASIEEGGCQQTNYIQNLTNLAKENISFSNTDKLGGFKNTSGTSWTMGSLMATTSGVPFSFPLENYNSMDKFHSFASGITTMGDVLHDQGYNQAFLCGSDGDFAGRKSYFQQHGNYEVYDLYTAREEGYIEEDYYVWWGYEDKILFEIAKDKILELANKEEPFNFTMLTVDTHFTEGYECELCDNKYDSKTANIIACADRQVYQFVEWLQNQEFFTDSVVVITGDHQRMDNYLVDNIAKNERTIYNCFMNVDFSNNTKTTNRIFTPMDMFPTVLSAMGFEWKGNRLGLGTNLFSDKKTLAEELGFDYFNSELAKRSNYYLENFK